MLVRAEVSRRAEALNTYVNSLKDKIYSNKYKEAQTLISKSKDSINNSYMAPYNPNLYLLDSLRTRTDKLKQEKSNLEDRLARANERIQIQKLKRGLSKGVNEKVIKFSLHDVGVYASRITLTLKQAHLLDYERVSIQTDFFDLRILFGNKNMEIPYSEIVTFEAGDLEILLSWRNSSNHIENFLVLSFNEDACKQKWEKTIKFCKLIDQSKRKKKLFMKPQTASPEADRLHPNFQVPGYHSKDLQEEISNNHDIESIVKNVRRRKSSVINPKQLNIKPPNLLNSQSKKGINFDRIRRLSEYSPFARKFGAEETFKDNRRKVSADYTPEKFKFNLTGSGFFNERKMSKYKSQKSFGDNSPSNSNPVKEKGKESQKSAEEPQIPALTFRQKDSGSHKPKQIFVNNQSSIHWIQEEHEDEKSRSRDSFKGPTSQSGDRILNVFEQELNDSKHISQEEILDGEESPMLPYNMRKGRSLIANDFLTVKPIEKEEEQKQEEKAEVQAVEDQDEQDDEDEDEDDDDEENMKIGKVNLMGNENNGSNSSDAINQDNEKDHQSSSDASENETQKYFLEDLNKGITLLKCAENGWQSHVKKLYLSINHNDLCWSNPKGDNKSVPLANIVTISKGHRGKGIAKHLKKQISAQRCLIIKTNVGNQTKFLQFYLQEKYNVEALGDFVRKLETYWKSRFKAEVE